MTEAVALTEGTSQKKWFARDLASAHVAALARAGAWALITAMLFRRLGEMDFAPFALARSTLALLNNASLGLGPASVRLLAAQHAPINSNAPLHPRVTDIYSAATKLAFIGMGFAIAALVVYSAAFNQLHLVPALVQNAMPVVVICLGLGLLLRLAGEPSGAVLQTNGRLWLDNLLSASAELIWVAASAAAIWLINRNTRRFAEWDLIAVGGASMIAGLWFLAQRMFIARRLINQQSAPATHLDPSPASRALLALGIPVVIAQLADYLYAPTDCILINHFLDPRLVADYLPALQIDAALLLLANGAASALLPRAAIADQAGRHGIVRMYYIRGTILTAVFLAVGALAIWLLGPLLLTIWLGRPVPETLAILPLVLLHTVIGGSSAIGRTIFLARGKVNAFAASVLIAGACNVIASYILAVPLHMGLRGIVLGTIIVVVGRCAIWMPWYLLRRVAS